MNLVIFNHGQVMRTTPELAPPSTNFHTTTTGGLRALTDLTRINHSTWQVFSGTRAGTHRIRRPRVRNHDHYRGLSVVWKLREGCTNSVLCD
ncbi:hypothetical protein TNCV_2362531 [Trichonephila clavipes]|nr:hypothetical protein TNCV_2362531 [Trichonephila clavipes]